MKLPELNTVVIGDCLDVMRSWPDGCVDMCVTSPPYWGLRDYGVDGQIGLEPTPEEFVAKMVEVFREVRRVLADHGVCFVNLGDSYASGEIGRHDRSDGVDCKYSKGRTSQGKRQSRKLNTGLKPKDLVGIPWRVALALQSDGAADPKAMRILEQIESALLSDYETWDDVPSRTRREIEHLRTEHRAANQGGWYLRQDIIWAKPNPMPESVTDRCTKAHEYLFLLTKKPRYFWDAEAIKEDSADPEGSAKRYKSEFFVGPKHESGGYSPNGATHTAGMKDFNGTRNRRSVWTIPTEACPEAHFATYPKELVRPCILAGTSAKGYCPQCGKPWVRVVEKTDRYKQKSGKSWNKEKGIEKGVCRDNAFNKLPASERFSEYVTTGWRPTCTCGCEETRPGIVLDPFGGSGTTGVVAAQEKRDYLLIELSEDYAENIARPRLASVELNVPVSEQRAGQMALFGD